MFAQADVIAFLCSGAILKFFTISQGLGFSYSLSLVAGLLYLVLYSTRLPWVIPTIVFFSRIGGSMSFNIGYVSVARLFPTKFVSTVFGIVNFVSHSFTVGAPMAAELPEPFPFVIFCSNSFAAIFVCFRLVELDRAKKIQAKLAKKQRQKSKE